MRALALIIALAVTNVSAQSNLPACSGSDVLRWSNCSGTYTWPDGGKYVGEYKNGQFHGQGTLFWPDGFEYVGEFRNSKIQGQGTLTGPNGYKYVGEFRDDKLNGQGIRTFTDGSPPQEGIWKNDKFVRAQRIPDHIAGRASSAAPATNSNVIESASQKCEELGFKKGTEKFGDCVLKISK